MNDMLYGAHMYMFHYDYNAVVPVARVRIKYACPRGILPGKCSHTHAMGNISAPPSVISNLDGIPNGRHAQLISTLI